MWPEAFFDEMVEAERRTDEAIEAHLSEA